MANATSDMLKQVAENHAQAKGQARGEKPEPTEELPQGASTVEEGEETPVVEEEAPEEAPNDVEGDPAPEEEREEDEDEGPIRIAGREFKSSREALAYAEEIERERLLTEAHAAGIREALEATRQPTQPQPEPEDDFEQRFYENPKKTLKEIEEAATKKALAAIDNANKRERLWKEFLDDHPDIRRKDAERVLQENWDTIGKMTDFTKARTALARAVRSEYEEIRNLTKPRTALPQKKQVVSAGTGARPGVTQAKKEDRPLSFAEQVRKLKGLS